MSNKPRRLHPVARRAEKLLTRSQPLYQDLLARTATATGKHEHHALLFEINEAFHYDRLNAGQQHKLLTLISTPSPTALHNDKPAPIKQTVISRIG